LKRTSVGLLRVVGCVLGLWAALASAGCSDSEEGDPAASLKSCNDYCDAYSAAACMPTPLYPDAAACKSLECADIPVQPAICQTEFKVYYDCKKAQADLCADDGCDVEFGALLTCH
jgi:hypothetical protein